MFKSNNITKEVAWMFEKQNEGLQSLQNSIYSDPEFIREYCHFGLIDLTVIPFPKWIFEEHNDIIEIPRLIVTCGFYLIIYTSLN